VNTNAAGEVQPPHEQGQPAQAGGAVASRRERDLLSSLHKISGQWQERAQVRAAASPELEFHEHKPDFPTELLPFHGHAAFDRLGDGARQKLTSYGWLLFNQKAIDVEKHVLLPGCSRLMECFDDAQSRPACLAIQQSLIDEAYHIALMHQANELTLERRRLSRLALPRCNVMLRMRAHQERCGEPWQRDATVIAAAIATEVFISGYLRPVSRDTRIQDTSRLTTRIHLIDEGAHAGIFKMAAELCMQRMSPQQLDFFVDALLRAMAWFHDPELGMWRAVLHQTGVHEGPALIADCAAAATIPRDHPELFRFLAELEIDALPERIERAFSSEAELATAAWPARGRGAWQ
jgi:alpha-N-dichloroacetyl-p-aminophenylserinol N-oxygenase